MRQQLIELGVADADELDDLDRSARELFADPDRVIVSGLPFTARGRKPA